MRDEIIDLADRYFDGRMRERASRHLGAAVDAIDDGKGVVLVVRVPKGNTGTVEITAYPPTTNVMVDQPPIA